MEPEKKRLNKKIKIAGIGKRGPKKWATKTVLPFRMVSVSRH